MENIAKLVRRFMLLMSLLAVFTYGVIFWFFSINLSQITSFYQTIAVSNFIHGGTSNLLSNQWLIPVLFGYLIAVLYISAGKYYRDEARRYPRSRVLIQFARRIYFLIPMAYAYLVLVILQPENLLQLIMHLTAGLGLYYIIQFLPEIILSFELRYTAILSILAVGIGLFGLTQGTVIKEISLLGFLISYLTLLEKTGDSFYKNFAQSYETNARNYLAHNEEPGAWEETMNHIMDSLTGEKDRKNEELGEKLLYSMPSMLKQVWLIRGSNFIIFLTVLFFTYHFDLSLISLGFSLIYYPILVAKSTQFDFDNKGPMKVFMDGEEKDGVFITDENDMDGYYILLTAEGEEKVRAENVRYKTYETKEKGIEKIKEELQKIEE